MASMVTNRGNQCGLRLMLQDGWCTADASGTFTSTKPPTLGVALCTSITLAGSGTLADVKLTNQADADATVLMATFNIASTPSDGCVDISRIQANWTETVDSVNEQVSLVPAIAVQFTPAVTPVTATYAVLIDAGTYATVKNILVVWDFGGPQTLTVGNTWTINSPTIRYRKV